MSRFVIVLNGPPGCGKDTIKAELLHRINNRIYLGCSEGKFAIGREFKTHLHELAILIAKLDRSEWFTRYEDRALKETPWDKLGGLSQRQFLIKISEEWVKPVFGKSYFGQCLAAEVMKSLPDSINIVSDGGFIDEIYPLVNSEDVKVIIVKIHREGASYANDSRRYIDNSSLWQTVEVMNVDGKLEDTVYKIINYLELAGVFI